MHYYIVENSFFARIARMVLKTRAVAMVLGRGIHLSGVSRDEFLKDRKWVRHELVHIEQFRKYGMVKFLWLYLTESLKKGYYNNRFEVEAREKSDFPEP